MHEEVVQLEEVQTFSLRGGEACSVRLQLCRPLSDDESFYEALRAISSYHVVKTVHLNRMSVSETQLVKLLDALSVHPNRSDNYGLEIQLTDVHRIESRIKCLSTHEILQRVTTVGLTACKLSDASLAAFISKMALINCLKKLEIQSINMSTLSNECLYEWLCHNACSLEILSLNKCGLSRHVGGEIFFTHCRNFSSLKSLSLAQNHFHPFHINSEYLELCRCKNLKQLCLDDTPIPKDAAFMLGFVLRISNIQSISLSNCQINDEQLSALVEGIFYADTMRHLASGSAHPPLIQPPYELVLQHDSFKFRDDSFEEEKSIIDCFCADMTNGLSSQDSECRDSDDLQPLLLDINLSYNRFHFCSLLVPLLFNKYVGLSCLNLGGNRFYDGSFLKLCESLSYGESLQFLSLNNCNLSLELLTQFLISLLKSCSTKKSDSVYQLAMTVASTDYCCSVPYPIQVQPHGLILPMSDTCCSQKWLWRGIDGVYHNDLAASSPRCVPPLRYLDISVNWLGFKGAKFLRSVLSVRKWHPIEELLLGKNNIGVVGFEHLLNCLETDETIRFLSLNEKDFADENYSVPPEISINSPGKVIRTLPLNSVNKYIFLMSIEKSEHLKHLYLPPEIVRLIFSYLVCRIHRTVLISAH